MIQKRMSMLQDKTTHTVLLTRSTVSLPPMPTLIVSRLHYLRHQIQPGMEAIPRIPQHLSAQQHLTIGKWRLFFFHLCHLVRGHLWRTALVLVLALVQILCRHSTGVRLTRRVRSRWMVFYRLAPATVQVTRPPRHPPHPQALLLQEVQLPAPSLPGLCLPCPLLLLLLVFLLEWV